MTATPFSSCVASGATYNCGPSITIPKNTTVNLSSDLTLQITSGGLTIGDNVTINSNGFVFLIKLSEDVNLGNFFVGAVSIQATGATINVGANSTITGNLTATTLKIPGSTIVYGVCNPSNARCIGGVSAPTVVTSSATSVSTTGATLNSTVTANGASTAVTFEYGSTSGNYTATGLVATGSPVTTTGNPSYSLSGLTCGTTYYFRAQGVNTGGTAYGSELSFATLACAAGVFDAYETTTYTSANAIANAARIKTHVASNSGICVNGGVCNLTIGSFNSGKSALNTTFTGPVKVEIVDVTTGDGCSTATAITTVAASQTLSGTGETTVTLPAVPNSYPNARIRVTYPTTGTVAAQNCSVDNFAIRPSSFGSVSAKDATWSTAGSTNTLTNKVLATATPIHKAGRPFSLNAIVVNVSGTTTSNYSGTPTTLVAACSGGTACIGTPGALTVGGSFVAGVLTSTAASYSDVGAFNLTLQDASFANVDAGDSSTSERYISSSALDVGRFVPDHFDTVVGTQGCSTFTYSGQPLTLFTVSAKNVLGSVLTNYASSGVSQTVSLSDANGVAGSLGSTSVAASTFVGGVSTTTPTFTFTSRTASPTIIKLRAVDADSVSSSTGTDGTAATAIEGTSTIVSGRVKLLNIYGSEQLGLPLPVIVEYYDTAAGAGWRRATSSYVDTCTSLTAGNFAFATTASSCATAVPSCITALAVTATGSGPYKSPWTVSLSAASPPAAGNMCITLSLDGTAAGNQCTSTGAPGPAAISADAPWLKYPWVGGTAGNPAARATFGIYKSPLIYRRENY